jgi:predicted PurR-regulated permease PerM
MLGGGLSFPPPPERLTSLPIIGEPLGQLWNLASLNFTSVLSQIAPQLRTAAQWLLQLVAGVSFGVLSFMASIVVAGLLLAHAHNAAISAHAVARRLAGERGPELIDVAEQTIRGVTRGLLGTALIQSTLAGLGFLAIGLRGAAFLALICFFLCVIQIGPILVLLPAVIWVFMHSEALPAVLFLIWCIFVGLIDNFLRPYLMSRGSSVPLLVILIGTHWRVAVVRVEPAGMADRRPVSTRSGQADWANWYAEQIGREQGGKELPTEIRLLEFAGGDAEPLRLTCTCLGGTA